MVDADTASASGNESFVAVVGSDGTPAIVGNADVEMA